MDMGEASAHVVATNTEIQLNGFTAAIFKGHASGNARIAIGRGGQSRIAAQFADLELAGPLAAFAGAAVAFEWPRDRHCGSRLPWHRFQQASEPLLPKSRQRPGRGQHPDFRQRKPAAIADCFR